MMGVRPESVQRRDAISAVRGAQLAPGFTHYQAGRFEEAAVSFARALALAPHDPAIHHALGAALGNLTRLDEAEVCFRRVLAIRPRAIDALVNLGHVLRQQERFEEAAWHFGRALGIEPGRADIHNALGICLSSLSRYRDAEICFRRTVQIEPNFPDALTNFGATLRQCDRFDEAEILHRRALVLDGKSAYAHWHLGVTLREAGRLSEAVECYRRAVTLDPEHRDSNLSLGLGLLAQGDIPAGSIAYEARWGMGSRRKYPLVDRPVWDGAPMPGKTLLLFYEQGLGDVIQFARFAKLVRPLVGRLVLRCQEPLRRVMAMLPVFDAVVSDAEPMPPSDTFIPMLSLMRVLGTRLGTIPSDVPYLAVDPTRARCFAARLDGPGLRVGIVWAGNAKHPNDRRRSLPLNSLGPLFDIPGVRFVSLQVGPRAADLHQSPFSDRAIDLGPDLRDFTDTGAALSQLDLLISADTSVAHLAGALGRATWVLLPVNADWRWLRNRDDSPWYPTLRLYRQDGSFDWGPVVERVRRDLLAVVSSGSVDTRATRQDGARSDRALAEKLRDETGSGLTHFRAGRFEEAAAHFARAAALAPRDANIHHALGSALGNLKRADEALACFARAIALAPHEPRFHYALGVELGELSRLGEAEACFRRALAAQPDFVDASLHLGHVLRSQDRFEEAASCFLSATTQSPDRADAHNALGAVLIDLRRYAEAELPLRRALDISRDYPQALTNLGVALAARDQFEEAEALHRRALAHSEFVDAWLNLGLVLHETGRLSEAVACYRRAIAIAPDHSNAHLCLSITLLAQGDVPAGSAAYEGRWGLGAKCKYPLMDRPFWDGTPIPGKTLLLVGEQGRGDAIQFARYAKLVRPRVGRLLLRCRPALRGLLATLPDFDAVVSEEEPIPRSDAFLPIMSLMHVLGTTLDTIPAEVPYLHADPARARRFAARLTGDRLKIGIVWAGIAGHTNDRHRSISLATLAPLLDVSGAHFVSLQLAPRAAELRESAFAEKVTDLAPDLADFADTAAALSGLDLLISVDTAVAHLAGALGLPAWVLLPFNADWRWLRDRDDSPWYPTLRLYRQDASFAWAPVIERVRGDLLKRVGERVFGRK